MLIKAGKALNETKMEVRVQFKSQPGFFGSDAAGMRQEFVMQLKPKEAMYMKTVVKKPGLDMDMTMSELDLTYNERYASLGAQLAHESENSWCGLRRVFGPILGCGVGSFVPNVCSSASRLFAVG
jgi:glucose-6-phosphate 1-dehydrogenase